MKTSVALLSTVALIQSASASSIIYSDTFDRTDSRNIDGSLSGITDNTGSSLTADAVYSQPWLDPNNAAPTYGVQDGDAANGGGAQIIGGNLQLSTGAGTSNAFVNHNFTNAAIASEGNFSVSLDVLGYAQADYRFGGGFGVGMSLSEAASAGDAFDNSPGRYTGAFNDASTIGLAVPGTVLTDFWVAIRGNGTLVWGGSSGNISGATGLGTKTGNITVDFSFADFNAGSTVSYEIFLDAASKGSGSFVWSGTNENYIGIDSRDSSGVNFDNFSVSYIPEPSAAVLGLLGLAGVLRRRR